MERYDAIVLGIGGVGSAALYHLARRGIRAIGIDRFNPPHDRGSSHGQTRVIRQAYFEHSDYVPLLREAYRLWHELESVSNQHLFYQIGLVEVGPPEGVVVPGVLRAADEHQLRVESLSAQEIERRWPGLKVAEDLVGVFEPAAGYLRVESCVKAHIDAARAAGAEIIIDTEVQSWTADAGEVRLRTTSGLNIAGDRLIIAAGPWATRLLADLNVSLSVRRKSLFWFATGDTRYDEATGMPVFLFELPEGVFYGFPRLDERGVKFAEHTGGRIVDDPLAVDRSIDPDEQRRLIDVVAAAFARSVAARNRARGVSLHDVARRALHRRSTSGPRQCGIRGGPFRPRFQIHARAGPRTGGHGIKWRNRFTDRVSVAK